METYSSKKRTITGSIYDDEIHAQDYFTQLTGKKFAKGLVIKGGKGNDKIWDTQGYDTITGGSGANEIYFNKNSAASSSGYYGFDTINLSKNEELTIQYDKSSSDNFINYHISKYDSKNIGISVTESGYSDTSSMEILIKNMAKSDITNKLIFKIADEEIDLKKYTYDDYAYTKKYIGSWLNENIHGDEYYYINQTINAGGGDDTIDAGIGNDVITGGTGTNTIKYQKGDGNDTINLTKNETLIIDLKDINKEDLRYSFSKGSLLIKYIDDNLQEETIKINNFAKKDVVGVNGNVYLTFNGNCIEDGIENVDYINLKTYEYVYDDFTNKKKSYNGNWLNEEINAANLNTYEVSKNKGVSINSGAGNDKVIGSKYNDTIKAGSGDDEINAGEGSDKIYGGLGDNKLYFKSGDGSDTVYSTKNANDTLVFTDAELDSLKFTKEKNNLIITGYGTEDDKITVVNYYKGNSSVKMITTKDNTLSIEEAISKQPTDETPENDSDNHDSEYDGKHIVGTNGNDKLNGTDKDDIIHGKLGADTINGYGGNDSIDAFIDAKIDGGAGDDYIRVEYGFSTIYGGSGNDEIYGSGRHNEIYGEDGNDTITGSSSYIDAGSGNDEINISGVPREKTTVYCGSGNDKVFTYSGETELYVYGEDGDDTFEINANNGYYYGGADNDKYIVNVINATVKNTIYDNSGENDFLVFNYVTKADISLYANVKSDGTYDKDLIFLEKYSDEKSATTIVKDYFGDGKIETIKVTSYYNIDDSKFDNIIQEVASWLSSNNYDSVQAVMDSNNKDDISIIYAQFSQAWT